MRVLEREVGEERLHDALRVVERPGERDVEDVVVQDARHLQLLHGRDAPRGMEDEDADALAAAQAVDGGGAGVAGGGDDDVELAAALAEDVLEEVAEELQREVLERERGAVEELQQVHGAGGADGRDLGAGPGLVGGGRDGAERRVGLADDRAKVVRRDVVREEPDRLEGQVGVGEAGPGEAHEDRFPERNRGDAAAGGDVGHHFFEPV